MINKINTITQNGGNFPEIKVFINNVQKFELIFTPNVCSFQQTQRIKEEKQNSPKFSFAIGPRNSRVRNEIGLNPESLFKLDGKSKP